MNYFNEDEKRGHAPPILGKPGVSFKKTSAFGRPPAFSRAAGSLMERIRNLSKKDLAFVAVGLGVLITAPVAEYMMSKPTGAEQLTSGFGSRGDAAGSLYEPGINSLAQGSPDGAGEVVTLLSSRDPASLIIGSEASQPPAAPQQPAAPRTDFRDSMKDSARNAFTEASKAAGVPSVIPKMQSSLRAMGSFFSGGEGTRTAGLGGDKILSSAKNASGKSATRSMVGPVGGPSYKGVASNSHSADKGAFDKLRAQADKAAGNFNGDSSIRSLDKAAADSADLMKGDGGMSGTDGDKYTRPSGSSIDNKKNYSRGEETLAEAAAKARQAKALDWEFYKKYEIPKQIINAMLTGMTGSLTTLIGGITDDMTGQAAAPAAWCWVKGSSGVCYPAYKVSQCGSKDGPKINCSHCVWTGPASGTPPAGAACSSAVNPVTPAPPVPVAPVDPNIPVDQNNPNGGHLPNTVPASYTDNLAKFDEALVQLVDNVRQGEKTTEPKVLLQYTKAAADSINTCVGIANTLYGDVKSKTPTLVNAEKGPYHTAILAATTKVTGARQKYDTFAGKVDSQIASLEGGKKAQVGDAEVVQTGSGVTPLAVLKAVKAEADNYQKNSIVLAEANLAFHNKAEMFYGTQSGLVTGQAGAMNDKVGETSGKVADLIKGLKDKDGKDITDKTAALPDNVTIIKDTFKNLTGEESAVPAALPAAGNTTHTIPTPPDPPAQGGNKAYMYAPMDWRGAKTDTLWNEKKVDDSGAKKAESDVWAPASPFTRLQAGNVYEEISPASEIGGNFIALAIRGVSALPYDIKGSNSLTAEIMQGMETLESMIATWTTQLHNAGVNLDGGTGTVTPTPSGDSVTPADKSKIMDSAGNVASYNSAAVKTMGDLNANKRKNAAFKTARYNAQAQYDIMQNRQSRITILKGDIEADPKKATTAQYKELERLAGDYNAAKKGDGTSQNQGFDQYAKDANAAGKPVAAPVKPAPAVIVRNNVQGGHGGNAAAISDADAHSGANANAGAVVKPTENPVVVQPAAKAKAPGSFNMGDKNFLPTGGIDGDVVSYTSRLTSIGAASSPYYTINCVRKGAWFKTSGCRKYGAVYGRKTCTSLDNKSCGPAPSK